MIKSALARKEQAMMSEVKKKTGGPAFPAYSTFDGMTLRDWFAGQIAITRPTPGIETGLEGDARWAQRNYELADAMLTAREK